MDGMYLPPPGALFDYLAAEKAAARRQQKKPRPRTFLPLVHHDRLYFEVVSDASQPRPSGPDTGADPVSPPPAETFRQVFVQVWWAIPDDDRAVLLRYWHTDRHERWIAGPWPHPHHPLIRVVDIGPLSATNPSCDKSGHVLNFSAQAIRRGDFSRVLAEVLVQVYRYATAAHWDLVQKMIEEPLARWERRHGRHATEAEHEKQVAALERRFLQRHEREFGEVLARWGFDPEPCVVTRHDKRGKSRA